MKSPSDFSAYHLLFLILSVIFFLDISNAIPGYFLSNPASLNLLNQPHNSLRYLKIDLDMINNALTFSQINNNFVKDTQWDSIQKTTIFNAIPDEGFKVNADAAVTPIEFSSHLFSASFQYQEMISGNAPKDLLDIALFGNDLNRHYDISKVEFNRLGYFDFSLGFCYSIIKNIDNRNKKKSVSPKLLNLGAKCHWLKGRAITQTDSSFGSVMTTPDIFLGQLKLYQSTAYGASNFAFDVGAATQLQSPVTLGIALLNLNTGFTWSNQPKQKVLEISIDSFSLQRYIETGSIDSFYLKTDSTKQRSVFKTSLPSQLLLQASYQPIKLLTLSTYYHRYSSNSRFITDFSRSLNFNLYLHLCRFFATELSFTTDLKKDFIISHNIHIFIKRFNFNLAIDQRNGYLGSAKGIGLNLNLGQNW